MGSTGSTRSSLEEDGGKKRQSRVESSRASRGRCSGLRAVLGAAGADEMVWRGLKLRR
jgi:hypothetical protein